MFYLVTNTFFLYAFYIKVNGSPMLIIAIVNVIILKGFFISSERLFFVKVKHFFNWYEMFTSLI